MVSPKYVINVKKEATNIAEAHLQIVSFFSVLHNSTIAPIINTIGKIKVGCISSKVFFAQEGIDIFGEEAQ